MRAASLLAAPLFLFAQATLAAAPGDEEAAARLARIEAALTRAIPFTLGAYQRGEGDEAGCWALFAGVEEDLRRDWSRTALLTWQTRLYCVEGPFGGLPRRALTQPEMQALWQPLFTHFAAMPAALREKDDLHLEANLNYWYELHGRGYQTTALALEQRFVDDVLSRAAATPPEAQALATLQQLGRKMLGRRAHGAFMARLHARLTSVLGAGHVITLEMMRAHIFNHRQLGRPAQALAMSDEYAALLAAHHPQNERLAMINLSERVGALAGVGRFADAQDAGQQLLRWLRQQQPVPYGNVMRSAYNLAGLSIEIEDYDQAIEYAQLSIDQGAMAATLVDRYETWLPRVLRAQAQVLKGQAGATLALRQALEQMPLHELGMAGPAATLLLQAQRDGDAPLVAWARATLDDLVRRNTTAFRAERALPLALDARAGPAGDSRSLELASQAAAYGLVERDLPLGAMAHFTMARHVAPLQAHGAVWLYKRGANALHTLRQGLPEQAHSSTQSPLLASYEADLRAFIGLLIDEGRLAEAQQAIESLREEELVEFRRRSRGARNGGGGRGGVTEGLAYTPAEQALNIRLQPTAAALKAAAQAADLRADELKTWPQRAQAADEQAATVLANAAQALRTLALEPAARATRPAPYLPRQAALPKDQARATFLVGAETLEVLLQVGPKRHRLRLPYSATALNRSVNTLRTELARPGAAVPAMAQQLYRWLLAPMSGHLAGVKHLSLAPDGALRYVPFAALHDGKHYLAERYSISVEMGAVGPLERARAAAPVPAATATKAPRLAAFGRTLPDARHSALPGVREELAVLGALRGAAVAQGLDAQFTAQALQQALALTPQVVHLASHFVLDAAGEEASYLLLGDGNRMSLRQLRELPWAGVHLALLSACDSGLALDAPSSAAQGRELAGFAATLHAAGVRNVMATLWRIDDASTAQWMQAFYAPWQQARRAVPLDARHLARVQREWLQRHAGTALAHPYHWAAFSWMGEPS